MVDREILFHTTDDKISRDFCFGLDEGLRRTRGGFVHEKKRRGEGPVEVRGV